ncbi:MAG: c-type cytochrome biogenesis protein CcmI [Gammaproteobacteria bacterium]|nr:c-type cytochrome biogenesis protein CcmI [Gammaproteobacteria bacterium]
MITFWIVALLLSLLASAFVFLPVLVSSRRAYKGGSGDQARSAINIEIFKQRLAELEASRAEWVVTDEVFEQLKLELEQELLADVQSDREPRQAPEKQAAAQTGSSNLLLPLTFAAVIPLLAVFLYADWGLSFGSMSDVLLAEELDLVQQADHTEQDMSGVIRRLRESLSNQPENDEGWMLLARSLVKLGEYEQSADAFETLLDRYPQDHLLRSYYAESVYMADARQITPRVQQAIEATLALDSESANVLEMLGMEAYVSGDHASAIDYFERIIAQNVSPERTQMLQQSIAEARELLGESAPVPAAAASSQTSQQPPGIKAAKQIFNVLVEIDNKLPVDANDTVFVFARAAQGPPMPLAVERMMVSDLPRMVRLDDTMSMLPERNILTVGQVQIVARVSRSGEPTASPGDYQAISESLTVDSRTQVVKLRISELVK